MRLVEEIGDPHLLIVHRVFESRRGVGDLGDEDHEQKDMRHIKLPGAAQHLRGGVERAFLDQPPAIGERRGKSGNEDEDLGRVKEPDRLEGEITQDIFGDMVDENEYQRQAAKEIETQVA